jgi:colanic acid biosynthesis glycosyl transferase WcaI
VRALLCSINYAPELTGIGKYTGEMAEWLAARGAEVTVVTARPYYPAWRVEEPYRRHRYRYLRETIAGVDVIRCPIWVPSRPTGLTRLLHLASFALSSLPVMLWLAARWRPRLVFVVEPPLFAAPVAWIAARLSGAKAWLHVQDFEVDAAFELGMLRAGWLRRLVAAAERGVMRSYDRVSTISEQMLRRVAAKRVDANRARLFPNWVDLDRIRPLSEPPALRAAHFGADDVVVLYSGSMGAKHGLDTVLGAAKLIGHTDGGIHFVFCGAGADRAQLERAATGTRNVTFWPLVPGHRLNELLNVADIHVLPQRADAADLVFPSKLTNMLASGRPVVATAGPGTQVAVLLERCGVVVPPGDAPQLAQALRSLANDRERRRALGASGRAKAERLWDKDAVLAAAFREYLSPRAQDLAPRSRPTAQDLGSLKAEVTDASSS